MTLAKFARHLLRRRPELTVLSKKIMNCAPAEFVAVSENGMIAFTTNSNGRFVTRSVRDSKGSFGIPTKVYLPGQPNQVVANRSGKKLYVAMSHPYQSQTPPIPTKGGLAVIDFTGAVPVVTIIDKFPTGAFESCKGIAVSDTHIYLIDNLAKNVFAISAETLEVEYSGAADFGDPCSVAFNKKTNEVFLVTRNSSKLVALTSTLAKAYEVNIDATAEDEVFIAVSEDGSRALVSFENSKSEQPGKLFDIDLKARTSTAISSSGHYYGQVRFVSEGQFVVVEHDDSSKRGQLQMLSLPYGGGKKVIVETPPFDDKRTFFGLAVFERQGATWCMVTERTTGLVFEYKL
jgi:DNA-binding beta-propeller fold protein YncE